MADVFTALATDHEEVKGMLAKLEKGPTKASGASQDQLALRKKMTEELVIEESRHEALEEMYLWPAVREHHPAGNTLADEATGRSRKPRRSSRSWTSSRPVTSSSRPCSVRSSGRPGSGSSSRRLRCGRDCARS